MTAKACLSDVAEVLMGQSPPGDACNEIGNGIPLLNGPTEFGYKHPRPVQFTTEAKKVSEPGDLLFCVRGSTTGRMNWSDRKYAIGRGLAAIRGKNGYPNSYIRAVIQVNLDDLLAQATGSTFPNVSKDLISGLVIPSANPKSAQKIAAILEPIDDQITLLRETNQTLEAIAQAIFKSWFVDFDPVKAKAAGRAPAGIDEETAALFPDSFVDSESGPIPAGWRQGCLKDLADLSSEAWSARKHPETVSYLDLSDAKSNQISTPTDYPFDDAPSRARRVLRHGDTIVGTVRPGNRSFAFIANPPDNLTGSTGFAVLRPKAPQATEFVYLAATQDASIDHLAHIADGGAYPAVRPEAVVLLECAVPDNKVLEVFHSLCEPMFSSIASNQEEIKTLSDLRDTLLPRLISGKLRLPEEQAA